MRKMAPLYSVLSFFCGCGGMDLGFRGNFTYKGEKYKRLPFVIEGAFDFNSQCIETYNDYFKHTAIRLDLSTTQVNLLQSADILIGGFPCQEFSSCGPQGGLDSERGKLYLALVEYMKTNRPKIVVGENVINLERMDDGKVLKKIVSDFTDAGYRVKVWKLHAPDYGVPQRRIRLFVVCVRDDLEGFPEIPEPSFKGKHRSIEWAIGDLEGIIDESVPNQSQYFGASRAKRGNGQGDESNKKDKPAYTIRANPKSRVQFHYSLDRRLTVRECARLQTFPDDFIFKHSKTTSVSQIGNAVPPILAHSVATSIAWYLSSLEGNLDA